MAGESRIDILISARDQAKGAIESVKSELGGIGQTAGGLPGILGAASGALAAFGAVQLGQQVLELAKIGAQAERVDKSFRAMAGAAGQSADATLAALRKASSGAIADTNLELNANRARILGVADNAQQLSQLLQVARARGAAVGRTTAEAFDDIVTGIGRMSPLILDNLGIVTGGQKTFDDYAASIGKASSELTDLERKHALFNKVIEDSQSLLAQQGGAAEDSATTFERLDASIANAKEALGKFILLGGATTFVIGQGTQVVQFATMTFDNWAGLIGKAGAELGKLAGSQEAAASVTTVLSGSMMRSEGAIQAAADAAQRYRIHMLSASTATDAMRASVVTLAGALPGLQAQLNTFMAGAAQARASAVSALAGKAAGTKTDDLTRNKLYAEGIKAIDAQWQGLNKTVMEGGMTQDEFALKQAQIGIGAGDAYDAITQGQQEAEAAMKRAASEGESAYKKAAQEIQAAFDKLQGKVSGVLSGALSDIGGINIADLLVDPKETDPKKQVSLLPRDDVISEDARRLADIAVKGFDSPWYAYFKENFPAKFAQMFSGAADNTGLRQQAAQMLKNFQDGLEPELLDKEKAKERVRRMLIGEANLAALAKEIATELSAELGNAAPGNLADTVNVALGVRGAGAGLGAAGADASAGAGVSGATAGSAFATAAAEAASNTGTKMISALDAQLRADANVNLIKQAGESAGTNWGNGFMATVGNNIPKALIDLLSKLVTTDVIAYYNTASQLTGAQP